MEYFVVWISLVVRIAVPFVSALLAPSRRSYRWDKSKIVADFRNGYFSRERETEERFHRSDKH